MSARLSGPITLDLADGPVRTAYGRGDDGRQYARLLLGEGSDQVAVSVTNSPDEVIEQLEAAVAELRAVTRRQRSLRVLPEMAS